MLMGESMVEHINCVRTIADQLEGLGDPVAEKDLVMILLSSLPDGYNNLITTLETLQEEKLTWDYTRDRLLTEFERRHASDKNTIAHDALFAGSGSFAGDFGAGGARLRDDSRRGVGESDDMRRPNFICHYCKEPGHIKCRCNASEWF